MMELSIGLLMGFFLCTLIAVDYGNDMYREGQIDCINGNIKYELKEMPDHTKQWKEISPRADHQNSGDK